MVKGLDPVSVSRLGVLNTTESCLALLKMYLMPTPGRHSHPLCQTQFVRWSESAWVQMVAVPSPEL